MSFDPEPFVRAFRAHLPARGARSEFDLARRDATPVWIDAEGSLFAGVVLIVFESPGSSSVLDIKEQDVCVGRIDPSDPTRALAYVEASLRALPSLLDRRGDDIETMMPFDLLGFFEALADPSLRSVDDFVRALHDPVRVGEWLDARENDEWNELLESTGLSGQGASVRALERAAIRLRANAVDVVDEDAEPAARPMGATRIGGAPDLPVGMDWPSIEGESLTFVAQLDLASLAAYPAATELPRQGVLSFFYSPFRIGTGEWNPVRVFCFDASTPLETRALPDRVERVPEHEVDCEPERVFPPIESPFYEALLPEATQRSFRRSLREAARGGAGPVIDPLGGLASLIPYWGHVDPDRPAHRVLGYADSIQGDPYVDLETNVVRGGYDGWEDDSDEALALRKSARRWRLLLQIDASGDGELVLNQDGGFFYFWITEEALRAHDWSAVRGSLQCH